MNCFYLPLMLYIQRGGAYTDVEMINGRGCFHLALSASFFIGFATPANGSDLATPVAELEGLDATALDFSPDNRHLAIESSTSLVTQIWDVAERRIVQELPVGGDSIAWGARWIRYSPDGSFLAICHTAGLSPTAIQIYATSGWSPVAALEGRCAAIEFMPDGKELVVLTDGPGPLKAGSNIKFFSTSTWKPSRSIRTEPLRTRDLTVAGQCTDPLVMTPDMALIDPRNQGVFFEPLLSGILAVSKTGEFLALSGSAGTACAGRAGGFDPRSVVLNLRDRTYSFVIPVSAYSLDWSPDGRHIVAGMKGKQSFAVLDARTGQALVSESKEPENVSLAQYTPDGKYLIESINDLIEIWDGGHQHVLQTIHSRLTCFAVSRDSHHLAVGGNYETGQEVQYELQHSGAIHWNPKKLVVVYELR